MTFPQGAEGEFLPWLREEGISLGGGEVFFRGAFFPGWRWGIFSLGGLREIFPCVEGDFVP